MGYKLLWTGLTMIFMAGWVGVSSFTIAGSVIMIIGCILYWLDK